jgi:hypothetical protein
MRAGLKPFPASGFPVEATATGAAVPAGDGAERKIVVVEPSSVHPVAFPTASATIPPNRAQATATAANGAVLTSVEL